MKSLKYPYSIFLAIISLFFSSCVHEFTVVDHSFEFDARIVYDDSADLHRLTLTRINGAEDNQYNIAFTPSSCWSKLRSTVSPNTYCPSVLFT